MTETIIRPGTGIYPRADAARLLRMSPSRLRRWVSGYTYWLRDATAVRSRRKRPPVIKTDLPKIGDAMALSFLELMELRVVKAIVGEGVSLQHVRAAARLAAEHFHTDHPFASRRVFTDGRAIFSAVSDDAVGANIVRWRPEDIEQVIAGGVFDQFLREIEFDAATSLAERWWPLGRQTAVVLDPRIAFGAPIVAGTAVRTSVVAQLAATSSVDDAAIAYELERRQAEAAVQFASLLAAARSSASTRTCHPRWQPRYRRSARAKQGTSSTTCRVGHLTRMCSRS